MSKLGLHISDEVYHDLEFVFQYGIETFGILTTEKYLEKIHRKINELAEMPSKGQHHKNLPIEIKFILIESHMILYKYSTTQKIVYILRIMHKNMDIGNVDL